MEPLLIIMLQVTQLREYNLSDKKRKDVSFRFLRLWYNTGVFSSNYCQICKNTYFEEHLRTAAFESKIEIV